MSTKCYVKFDLNSGLDAVIHVWNMSYKMHNILQQTCVFLSSNRKSDDEKFSDTAGEEIGYVCWNVRILLLLYIT